ncbi:MAG: TIGR02597 family protein [Opitutaceae bacterium]
MNTLWTHVRRAMAGAWGMGISSGMALAAAAVTSEPVGFSSVSLLPASDTFVAVTFLRPTVFAGRISSVTGNSLAVEGAATWSAGQFVYAAGSQPNTYFILIGSGPSEGGTFMVTGNGANTITVDLAGGSLNGVAAGDAIRVVPYWTLGTLFPAASAGVSFTPTSDVASLQTVVSLFAPPSVGINPEPTATFFFFSGAWRQSGQSPSLNWDDHVVGLHTPMKVRNAVGGGVLVTAGAVVMQKLALPIRTQTGGQQDNPIALTRPVPVTLNDSGLAASGAFIASATALSRADLLMVTDNTVQGINKAASAIYIYQNSAWRKLGQPLNQDFGADVVFDSAKSVSIRSAPSSDGASRFWINPANY